MERKEVLYKDIKRIEVEVVNSARGGKHYFVHLVWAPLDGLYEEFALTPFNAHESAVIMGTLATQSQAPLDEMAQGILAKKYS